MTQKKSLQPTLDRALPSLPLMSVMGREPPPRGTATLIGVTSANLSLEVVEQRWS